MERYLHEGTLEITDPIFRRAKSAAAERGIPLRQFVTEAVNDKLIADDKATLAPRGPAIFFSPSTNAFRAVYSKSCTALRSIATTLGFASSARRRIFSAMCSAFAKNMRPSGRRSNRPEKLSSSGCSFVCGRNTFVPGLRPKT